MRKVYLMSFIFLVGCSFAPPEGQLQTSLAQTITAQVTNTPIPSPTFTNTSIPTDTPTPVSPPESFSKNKSQLVREGYSVVKGEVGWRITVKDEKDKEVEVATAVSEEKIAINVNGETKEFSQEAFVPMILNGDTVYLLTIQENGENVDYFYIKETGEWVTPIEVQTVPDNPENYTQIELEDVWSGRLLFSEMLVAEDFPEGTIVPEFFYLSSRRTDNGLITIRSTIYPGYQPYYSGVNEKTEPMMWSGFFQTVTEDGQKIVIASQQRLRPDGKSVQYIRFGFSDKWLERRLDNGNLFIIDVFFKSKGYYLDPVLYSSDGNYGNLKLGWIFQPTLGALYSNQANNPELLISDIISTVSGDMGSDGRRIDSAIKFDERFQNMIFLASPKAHSPHFFVEQE